MFRVFRVGFCWIVPMARPLKSTSKIYTAILKNIGSYIGKIIDHRIHEINRKDDRFKDEA